MLRQKSADRLRHNTQKQPLWKRQGWGRGWDQDLILVMYAQCINP